MKIMGVCILRIGDILMCAPALRALKLQHPDSDLHVLINSEFKFCSTFMPYVDQFHLFPRRELQENLGDPHDPILNSFDVLKDFLQNLKQHKFDVVYNFTHNRLSAYLCGALEVPEIMGMHGSHSKNLTIDGSWFRYLNRPKDDVKIHFSEIFQRAAGSDRVKNIVLGEDKLAKAWAAEICQKFEPGQTLVGLQCFSNEERKQVPRDYWKDLLSHEALDSLNSQILVLAAPWEESDAQKIVDDLNTVGLRSQILVCSFAQAFSLIKKLDVLITVDTSIKHLGSATETPIIEFALGGSRPRQTGVFSDNALIFEVHVWNEFSTREQVTNVAEILKSFLNHEKADRQFEIRGAKVYRPTFINHATWFLKDMTATSASRLGEDLLHQAIQIGEIDSLNGGENASLASSLAFSIADSLKSDQHELKVGFSEERLLKMQDLAHSNLVAMQKAHDNLGRVFSGRIHFLDWVEDCQISLQEHVKEPVGIDLLQFSPNNRVVDISEMRRIQDKLNFAQRRENWNLKFLRTLHNHITENLWTKNKIT